MSELSERLKTAMELVDSAVFPDMPLRVVIDDRPRPTYNPQFGFFRDVGRDFSEDAYFIYRQGIEAYFAEGYARHLEAVKFAQQTNFLARLVPDDLGRYEVLPYNEQETILAMAFHEVRHRIQFHLGVTLFGRADLDEVQRCRLWAKVQVEHYGDRLDRHVEFDAKFFECYGAMELRLDRLKPTAEQLKGFLLMTPYQFIKRERRKK